jgi:hypothetical protein
MTERSLPQPLYCCANEECCTESTRSAEDLWWSDQEQGWYCDDCWDYSLEEFKGISLAEELQQRGFSR